MSITYKYFILYIQPLKMELIEGSETLENYNRTPRKYPKEYIQYSKHGESLKSRNFILVLRHSCSRYWYKANRLTDLYLCDYYFGHCQSSRAFRITPVPLTMPTDNSGESPFSEVPYCYITMKVSKIMSVLFE